MPYFAKLIEGRDNVLDPFAGTGKIGKLKEYGYCGKIYANEIEPEWLINNEFSCDVISFQDAEMLDYPENMFDAIVTSPTYGNRMADHHKAKDSSKRITYTHCLGRTLNNENTGAMQFGKKYQAKHIACYNHLVKLIKPNGLFIVNVSNFIRKGEEVDVVAWTKYTLENCGLTFIEEIKVNTPRMGFGANASKRVPYESILVFEKH